MSSDEEDNGIDDDCDDSKQEDSRGHRQDDGVKDSSNDGSEVHCNGDDKEKKVKQKTKKKIKVIESGVEVGKDVDDSNANEQHRGAYALGFNPPPERVKGMLRPGRSTFHFEISFSNRVLFLSRVSIYR